MRRGRERTLRLDGPAVKPPIARRNNKESRLAAALLSASNRSAPYGLSIRKLDDVQVSTCAGFAESPSAFSTLKRA